MIKYIIEFFLFFIVFLSAFLIYHTGPVATEFIYYNF